METLMNGLANGFGGRVSGIGEGIHRVEREKVAREVVGEDGRDKKGRFVKGNRTGHGNPFARRMAAVRRAMAEVVGEKELQDLARTMYVRAMEGDMSAAKVLLAYVVGKPVDVKDPDRMDAEELELLSTTGASEERAAELADRMSSETVFRMARGIRMARDFIVQKAVEEMFDPEKAREALRKRIEPMVIEDEQEMLAEGREWDHEGQMNILRDYDEGSEELLRMTKEEYAMYVEIAQERRQKREGSLESREKGEETAAEAGRTGKRVTEDRELRMDADSDAEVRVREAEATVCSDGLLWSDKKSGIEPSVDGV